MKVSLYVISIVFLWQVIVACSANLPKQGGKPTIVGLQKNIANLVSDKSCDNGKQCQSIAYGAKACGGPTHYLIYSLKNIDAVKLSSEVKQYNQLMKEDNRRSGRISNCSILIPPTLMCRDNQCVATRSR